MKFKPTGKTVTENMILMVEHIQKHVKAVKAEHLYNNDRNTFFFRPSNEWLKEHDSDYDPSETDHDLDQLFCIGWAIEDGKLTTSPPSCDLGHDEVITVFMPLMKTFTTDKDYG